MSGPEPGALPVTRRMGLSGEAVDAAACAPTASASEIQITASVKLRMVASCVAFDFAVPPGGGCGRRAGVQRASCPFARVIAMRPKKRDLPNRKTPPLVCQLDLGKIRFTFSENVSY